MVWAIVDSVSSAAVRCVTINGTSLVAGDIDEVRHSTRCVERTLDPNQLFPEQQLRWLFSRKQSVAALSAIAEPMLVVWQVQRAQIEVLDKQLLQRAQADAAARRLMSIPAVGVIVALTYVAVIDTPERFRHSSLVGAYLGLTPRRYQSGDVDRAGHISKCGDGLLRSYLYQSANAILTRKVADSGLRCWGKALAARIGLRRAKVAVARKLAVVMHRIWQDGRDFDRRLAMPG